MICLMEDGGEAENEEKTLDSHKRSSAAFR